MKFDNVYLYCNFSRAYLLYRAVCIAKIFFLKIHISANKLAYFCFVIKQFISIVINLLDALKTSFSHRSMSARSLGRRDTVSEAAIASISMLKVNDIKHQLKEKREKTNNNIINFFKIINEYNWS